MTMIVANKTAKPHLVQVTNRVAIDVEFVLPRLRWLPLDEPLLLSTNIPTAGPSNYFE